MYDISVKFVLVGQGSTVIKTLKFETMKEAEDFLITKEFQNTSRSDGLRYYRKYE